MRSSFLAIVSLSLTEKQLYQELQQIVIDLSVQYGQGIAVKYLKSVADPSVKAPDARPCKRFKRFKFYSTPQNLWQLLADNW